MLIKAPSGLVESSIASFLRGFLRLVFKKFIAPPFQIGFQRFLINFIISPLLIGSPGTQRKSIKVENIDVDVVYQSNKSSEKIILYIHGGAYCLGNPRSHRSITTRLTKLTGSAIWVPNYRLAPEHPYPAGLNDLVDCYKELIARGHAPEKIQIGGDSAGGSLALALALNLRSLNIPLPEKIFLISPVTDLEATGESIKTLVDIDPMISVGWLGQAIGWYKYEESSQFHSPLKQDLTGFPPILVQVGEEEVLLSDSLRLVEHAEKFGVNTTLQIFEKRWHVFHLEAIFLKSARDAIKKIAHFCNT